MSGKWKKKENLLDQETLICAVIVFSRQILLQEASVSVRLLHLHYFSERTLLVGSSSIHGCGLFTLVDLAEGQMVIEYTGEVVRPCLTDHREVENERKVRHRKEEKIEEEFASIS